MDRAVRNLNDNLFFLKIIAHFFRKLKLYEEQELTMQVFSEPEMAQVDAMQVRKLLFKNSIRFFIINWF